MEHPRITLVENAIMHAANITIDELRGRMKHRKYTEPRMAVWYICHEHLDKSYSFLGKLYGRDHTTVMSGVQKMRKDDVGKKIFESLENAHPEIFEDRIGGVKTVENWKF